MNYVNQFKLPLNIYWKNAMKAAMILTSKQAAVLLDQHILWSATVPNTLTIKQCQSVHCWETMTPNFPVMLLLL